MTEINPDAIAATVATQLIKDTFTNLSKKTLGFLNNRLNLIFEDFEEYLKQTHSKCSKIKLIIDRGQVHQLEDVYVKSYFSCGDEIVDDNYVIQKIRDGQPVVVMGFGGIGKTIFSKKLWSAVFKEPDGKIPIFFELRQLNFVTDIDLLTAVRHSLSTINKSIDESLFLDLINNGRFMFIFDGFDELPENKKPIIERQLVEISHKCGNCSISVSGRYDDRFEAWERYEVYRARPFTKEQVIQLVENVNYDKIVAKKFLSEIVDKRYESYKSFLQTPLLSLMMLMTYSQSGEVPDKKSIFYKYAFMTLYSWHDGSKEAFVRERKTGLDIEQFEKLFSIICLMSYLEFSFQMNSAEFRNYVNKAKSYVNFDFNTEYFILEVVESVNLMFKEGDIYTFTHRSFQEYFTAFACVNYFQNKLPELTEQITGRGSDSVLSLMNDINIDVVDERILYSNLDSKLPELTNISKLTNIREIHSCLKIIPTFASLNIANKKDKKLRHFRDFNMTLCGHEDHGFWRTIASIKSEIFMSENGSKHPVILPIPTRYADYVLEKIITQIKTKHKSLQPFIVNIDYFNRKAHWNFSNLEEFLILDIFDSKTKVNEITLKDDSAMDVWAESAAQNAKNLAVFALKRLEVAKIRFEKKDKSIDEILGSGTI